MGIRRCPEDEISFLDDLGGLRIMVVLVVMVIDGGKQDVACNKVNKDSRGVIGIALKSCGARFDGTVQVISEDVYGIRERNAAGPASQVDVKSMVKSEGQTDGGIEHSIRVDGGGNLSGLLWVLCHGVGVNIYLCDIRLAFLGVVFGERG